MRLLPTRAETAIALAAGAGACLLPLLRTLGYESAMLLAILAGGVSLRRGLAGGRRLRAEAGSGQPGHAAGAEFAVALAAGLLAALPPLLLIAGATRLAQGCRLAPGALLVLFLALPAAAHLAATGLLVGAAFRRRAARIGALAVLVLLHTAHPAAQALSGRTIPHSLPFGFLSASGWGGVGSTGLDLPASYFLQRGLAVALCPLLVLLAGTLAARGGGDVRLRPVFPRGRLLVAAVPLAAAILFPSAFGLTTGAAARARALSGWTRTEHVTLRFPPEGAAAEQAGWLAREAEWDHQVASALMGLEAPPPVTVWLYDSEEQMRALTGARGFLFALPWRGEVHTVLTPRGAGALRHELVHVLASAWSRRPLRISWNQAMLEGTAEAIAACTFCGDEFQTTAAAAFAAGRLPPAAGLFGRTGFAWGSVSLGNSYRLAASFVGFLLERYGAEPVARAYGGASWREAFGAELEALDAAWRERLARVPVTEAERERARAAFDPARHPPFFRTRCPRVGEARPRARGPVTDEARNGGDAPDGSAGVPEAPEGEREESAARGLAGAARTSGEPGQILTASRRLARAGLPEEAIGLLREGLERAGAAGRAELSRELFLRLLEDGRAAEAAAVVDRMAAGEGTPAGADAIDIYRWMAGSPAGPLTARALLAGLDTPEGRAHLRAGARIERSGPAGFLAAEALCSWPPLGTGGAAAPLYRAILEAGRRDGPAALAALRLGELALRRGETEQALALFRTAREAATDPRRRLLAAEGAARAGGTSAALFVRSEGLAPVSAPAGAPAR